jgi:aldose sugar dehydrogenase
MKRRAVFTGIAASAAAFTLPARAAEPSLRPLLKGLNYPWGIAFLPDGSMLITERPGTLRRVVLTSPALNPPIAGTPDVDADGQGGLLDLAVDPDFAANRLVYFSFAERQAIGNATAVFRGRLKEDNSNIEDGRVIFRQNQAAESTRHFGSRLVFDRSGSLFVTTGDRGSLSDKAQDPASHIGKVLRLTRDGAPAPGNPNLPGWAPEVWSMGHRNIQGAALHPATGALWTIEHGAQGGDELNAPEAGKNYGWPVISYGRDYSGDKIGEGQAKPGMEQPLYYWDPSIAPSGLTFATMDTYAGWKGSLFAGALAGAHVVRLALDGKQIVGVEKLFEGFARFRDVLEGPDGRIYVLTDDAAPEGGIYVIA